MIHVLIKNKKAQIMLIDILLLLLIVIFIINIELENIYDYNFKIKTSRELNKILEQNIIVEKIISDCNFLAKYDNNTKICYKNIIKDNINITNSNIFESVCQINLNSKIIYNKSNFKKEIKNVYKRGVIYNKKFSIIEVGFCE